MKISFIIKNLWVMLVIVFLVPASTFPQSRINVEKLIEIDVSSDTVKSPTLFQNAYIHTELLQYLAQETAVTVSLNDSLRANDFKLKAYRTFQNYQKTQEQNSDEANLTILETLKSDLEKAIQLNPNDRRVKLLLNFCYVRMEVILRNQERWKEYIQITTNRLQLTDPKIQYFSYISLGNVYSSLQEIALAREAFNRAVELLFEFYCDSLEDGNQKYLTALYGALRGRGTCEEKLYLDEAARRSMEHAVVIAPDEHKAGIQQQIEKTLLWDGGNLKALEKRNKALLLFQKKEYKTAKSLLAELLPQLKTFRARAEIERYIAQLEFFYLGSNYQALNRMWRIVKQYPQQIAMSDTAIDSTYQIYSNTYAQMCYFQGIQEQRINRLRMAYIYFARAAEMESPSQYQAACNLAILLTTDSRNIMHADDVIHYGTQAWNNGNANLHHNLKRSLARSLARAYQQKGAFEKATEWLVSSYSIAND